MQTLLPNIRILRFFLAAWVMLGMLALLQPAAAATLRVGDTVGDLSFIARQAFKRPDGVEVPAGSKVKLADFAGNIVFLEWFAVWCPFCVAAVPQVEAQITKHYASRGGNPGGIPVIHVAVNQESRSFYQTQTDGFVASHQFGITLNDYDATSVNRSRSQFQSSGQPIFVVINGVTNSPTHKAWEVLVNHLGYGDTDFVQELTAFRAKIDLVQPAAQAATLSDARLNPDGTFEFKIQGPPMRSYRIEASSSISDWTIVGTVTTGQDGATFKDAKAGDARRYYRVVAE